MRTINIIHKVLSYYQERVKECKNSSEVKNCNKNLQNTIAYSVKKYPHLLHPLCDPNIIEESARELFDTIKTAVNDCYVPVFPTHNYFTDVIKNQVIETPIYDSFYNANKESVTQINNRCVERTSINDYLLNALISMPINKVHVTFVELGDSLIGDFFYQNLSSKIYSSIIKESDVLSFFESIKARIIENQQQYGNYPEYCIQNKMVPLPYEIIILPFNAKSVKKDYTLSHIDFVLKNGSNSGVYVVEITDVESEDSVRDYPGIEDDMSIRSKLSNKSVKDLFYDEVVIENGTFSDSGEIIEALKSLNTFGKWKFTTTESYNSVSTTTFSKIYRSKTFVDSLMNAFYNKCDFKVQNIKIQNDMLNSTVILEPTSITKNEILLKEGIKYINENAEKNNELPIIKQDYKKLAAANYEKDISTIILPIGRANEDVHFNMDTVSHAHAFVIGQSGSGKSLFLHNVITTAMLKYAPENLQLYLLDFKLGGVEFNRYKGVKHVKSLLVDNSDQQITLEILREIHEQMVERGKLLRSIGVNNLVEYNKLNSENPMPQMLIVVDECHEMFATDGIPRVISSEISDIVTKIAKEGRSQGVHLIMATQTLAGTDISNEILNNISDHYILKCAMTDSERLVERSSEFTSKLQTGQVFYHNVDAQITFQTYFIDSDIAKNQVDLINKKAASHSSNEKFYFNGLQLFGLHELVSNTVDKKSKYPTAYLGKNISIQQDDISIQLKKDCSENILVFGQNDQEQVTRSTMNIFLSLLFNLKHTKKDYNFVVIDCMPDEDSIYTEQLEIIQERGLCEIKDTKKSRGNYLKKLAEDILSEKAENTILLILGQERFREIKLDMEFEDDNSNSGGFDLGDYSFSSSKSNTVKSFRQAIDVILDKGSELGVHVIMQLDKPSNFLFNDYVSSKMIYQKFKHSIMLKSDDSASFQLNLQDHIKLNNLSKEPERLRAYYYSDDSCAYKLVTPYKELSKEELLNVLEKTQL